MGPGDADDIVAEIAHELSRSIAMKVSSSMIKTSVRDLGRRGGSFSGTDVAETRRLADTADARWLPRSRPTF